MIDQGNLGRSRNENALWDGSQRVQRAFQGKDTPTHTLYDIGNYIQHLVITYNGKHQKKHR